MIRMYKHDGGYMVFSNDDDVYKHLELGWEIVDEDHGKKLQPIIEEIAAVAVVEEPKNRGRKPK